MDKGLTWRAWAGDEEGEHVKLADVAGPDDPDLFCDIEDAHVQTVFRHENEFYVLLRGGRGWTTDPDTVDRREVLPHELVETSFAYQPTADQAWIVEDIDEQLRQLSATRSPVRLTCALWRIGALAAADGSFVPVPPL